MALVMKQERLQLARAVARGSFARLLTADNVAGPGMNLHEAVESEQAFFVTPRRDLLVVDVDLPDNSRASAEVLASFDLLLDAAQRARVPHTAVPSGRPGHVHGYLVVGTGQNRVRLERWCRSRGLDVRTSGIRPPGSPHRHSATTGWEPDLDAQEILTALAQAANEDATASLANQLCPITLPGRVLAALRHGHARAGYASPSHGRMALAVGVRARGGGRGLVDALLRDESSPLGESFRARELSWQRAEVDRIWNKAGVWIEAGGRPAPIERLREVFAAAQAWGWRGASGGSDLAVLEELVRRGAAVPTTTVGASLGDVAVGAGVGLDTARAALRRLAAAGWVKIVAMESARTARTYALQVPASAIVPSGVADAVGVPARDALGDLGADIARHGALGKVTMRVARSIMHRPGTAPDELARELSMTVAALRYHLRKLTRANLLARVGDGWTLTGLRAAFTSLAARCGVEGARERQEQALKAMRALRAAARAEFERLRPSRWTKPTASPPHPS